MFALRYRERVDEDADILGLGAANAAAAVSGTFVVEGSPTQTAIADRAGARSQVTQLVFAGVVLLVLLALTGPLQYLPRCVLAGIVFTIAVGMVDVAGLRRESPGEFYLAVVTAAAVVAIGVEQGIAASDRSVAFQARKSQLSPTHDDVRAGLVRPVDAGARDAGQGDRAGLVVYRVDADLFYANDNLLTDEVRALVESAPTPVRWFIVDAGAITDMDYSAAKSIRDLLDDLARQGVGMVFARVSP
ncbi:MAG TPA: SulP family inorganic anion transporter [Stellaceae bacterium]|nr:SulP family inorganic anion transporter [Stellaceae bacterium]